MMNNNPNMQNINPNMQNINPNMQNINPNMMNNNPNMMNNNPNMMYNNPNMMNNNQNMYNNPNMIYNNPNMYNNNPNMMPDSSHMIINNQFAAPGVMMGNPNDMFILGNMKAFYEPLDYMNALRKAKGAHIKQKVEILEAITGCETNNRYNVFLNYGDENYAYVFKCKEESDWISRNCLA